MTAGRSINTQSQHWGTPKKYVDAVKKVFGGKIALDPCSGEYSIVKAEVEYQLPERDGLRDSWNYPTIYINSPYGIDKRRGTAIGRAKENSFVSQFVVVLREQNRLAKTVKNPARWGTQRAARPGRGRAVCERRLITAKRQAKRQKAEPGSRRISS